MLLRIRSGNFASRLATGLRLAIKPHCMLAGSHKLLLLALSGRAPTSHVAPRNVLAKLGSTLSGLPPVSNCPSAQQAQSPSKKVLQHNSPSCADRDRLWLLAPALLYSLPASAAEGIKYAPGEGADVVKNIAGIAYAGLIAFWLFKVLGRRVKRGTTEVRLRSKNTSC